MDRAPSIENELHEKDLEVSGDYNRPQREELKELEDKEYAGSPTSGPSEEDGLESTPSRHESHTSHDEQPPASTLNRVLSHVTSRSSVRPGPPPDGGLAAWTAVFCGHLVIMNTWGFINSFGVFQPYYTSVLNRPPSDVSWIGSMQIFLLFFIGTFTGRLTDGGYFRLILFIGSIFQIVGIFASSWAHTYTQLFLSQGVCVGLGNGCLFCPTVAVVSTYFQKRRATAIGITACGSAVGGLVFPSIARQMLPTAGFGWAMRTIGFVQLAVLVVVNSLLRTRIPPRKAGRLIEWGAFKELEYTFYAFGSFSLFLGIYFAFYYISAFGTTAISPPLSYSSSLNLLLVLNGISVIGRLVPPMFADHFGAITVFIPTAFTAALLSYAWIAVRSPAGLYVWACFYGTAAGGIQSLFPAGLGVLTIDLRKQGTRMGMVFTICSFGVLIGPPVAGAILQASNGKYVGAQTFAATSMLLGAGLMVAAKAARIRRTGERWRDKV